MICKVTMGTEVDIYHYYAMSEFSKAVGKIASAAKQL